MKEIQDIISEQVIHANKFICDREGNPHHCFDFGKVESALHSSFYPGSYPFMHGGIAGIAGAMAFYLTQAHAFVDGNKRTAAAAATAFMRLNGWELVYSKEPNLLAQTIESCASGKLTKEEMMAWFEVHKRTL